MAKKSYTFRFNENEVKDWEKAAKKKQKKEEPNMTLWIETELNKVAKKVSNDV